MNINTNGGNNRNNRNVRSNRNTGNNRNIVNNNTNGVSFDSLYRGYSVPHSNFDDEFNMDFEYGYLNLMTNMHTFIRRAQTIYSRMETRISSIIESQTERRRIIEWDRNRNVSNSHQVHDVPRSSGSPNSDTSHISVNSHVNTGNNNAVIVEDNNDDNQSYNHDNDNDNDDQDTNDNDNNDDNDMEEYVPVYQEPRNIRVNIPNQPGNNGSTNARNARNVDVFDFISIFPRTVPMGLSTLNRNTGGISIRQIEENSEIMIYSSIPSSDVLNTECPISLTSFQPNSLVLRLNSCRHCFVPFRIMNWLETNSTCPLCRGNVIGSPSVDGSENRENRENRENIENNPSNPQINGLDISNNPVDISNIYNRLLNNNIFNNLSIEDRNNNSIVFSFDLPENQDNNVNNVNYRNSYIYPRLERLFSSYNRNGTDASSNNLGENSNDNTNNNLGNHYDEVD